MLYINIFNKTQLYRFKVGFYYLCLIGVFFNLINIEILLWIYILTLHGSIIIQTWNEYSLQIFRHGIVIFIFHTFEKKQLCFIKVNYEAKYNFAFNIHCMGFFFIQLKIKYIRAPPFRSFIKNFEWRIIMINKEDYTPFISVVNEQINYFIDFKDVHMKLNHIQVTEEVFLQFFGIHQRVKGLHENHYYIVYENDDYNIKKEVTKDIYYQYQSFKSMDIHEKNIFDRYIEHSELSEAKLYKKSRIKNTESMIDCLYKESVIKALYKAVASLPEVQKRRLILHYRKGLSLAQIAQKEHCSKSSVQCSIRIAINALKEKLNKFRV